MRQLRLLGLSEDRSNLLLTGPETGTVELPLDDRLRAAVLGDTSRLEQLPASLESALSPREIQARLRSGQTADQVALAAGVPVDRIRRFEGPIRDERARAADEARASATRRSGGTGRPMGEQADEHLLTIGADPDSVSWDSWRREDGTWLVQLAFRSAERHRTAHWLWDPARHTLSAADGDAAAISDTEATDDLLEGIAAVVTDTQSSRVGLTLVREDEPSPDRVVESVAESVDQSEAQSELGQAIEPPIDTPLDELFEAAAEEAPVVPQPEPEPVTQRRNGRTDRQAEADGVAPGRRASVPSWDEILFGTRPPER
jgi:hypothetical protein